MLLTTAAAATTEGLGSNHAVFASLVGLAILLAKLLELTVSWLKKKYTEDDEHHGLNNVNGVIPMVQLDPDTLKFFRSMQQDLEKSNAILEEHLQEEGIVISNVRDIASSLKDVSHSQERMSKQFDDRVDRLDSSMRNLQDQIHSAYKR